MSYEGLEGKRGNGAVTEKEGSKSRKKERLNVRVRLRTNSRGTRGNSGQAKPI